jgi:predicted outer membrane repeat protein
MYSELQSSSLVSGSTFYQNLATSQGGGIYNSSSQAQLSGCTFLENSSAGYGGAVSTYGGSVTVASTSFTRNTSTGTGYAGGAIYSSGGTVLVTGSSFSRNSANAQGGAIYIGAITRIASSSFSENSTASTANAFMGGGALYASGTQPVVEGCTFSFNVAAQNGGAVFLNGSASGTRFINCSFAGNYSGVSGMSIYNYVTSPGITNSVFWDSPSSHVFNGSANSRPTITYSNIQYGCASCVGSICGDGNMVADPQFVQGGSLRLRPTSPMIDAGNGCAAPIKDIAGLDRMDIAASPNIGVGPAVDIGAHEYQGGAEDQLDDRWISGCCAREASGPEHSYYYCAQSLTWSQAQAACELESMHLAVVTDAQEDEVVRILAAGAAVSLGGTDSASEGDWTWVSGEPWGYSNWAVGEPNNAGGSEHCLRMGTTGLWTDVSCAAAAHFVCETRD